MKPEQTAEILYLKTDIAQHLIFKHKNTISSDTMRTWIDSLVRILEMEKTL